MAAPKKHDRQQRRPLSIRAAPPETRASEAITVAWTLIVVTLVVCELMGLCGLVYLRFGPPSEGVRAFVGVTQFCALFFAVIAMAMLPLVYRVRRVRPPRLFVALAVIAACVPFVLTVWHALR